MDPWSLHGQPQQMQLVDVRESREFHARLIPGARWIPMNELPDRLEEIDRQTQLITVCRSRSRSGEMAEFLRERRYQADNLDGGIGEWARHDLPVRTPEKEQPGRVV